MGLKLFWTSIVFSCISISIPGGYSGDDFGIYFRHKQQPKIVIGETALNYIKSLNDPLLSALIQEIEIIGESKKTISEKNALELKKLLSEDIFGKLEKLL